MAFSRNLGVLLFVTCFAFSAILKIAHPETSGVYEAYVKLHHLTFMCQGVLLPVSPHVVLAFTTELTYLAAGLQLLACLLMVCKVQLGAWMAAANVLLLCFAGYNPQVGGSCVFQSREMILNLGLLAGAFMVCCPKLVKS